MRPLPPRALAAAPPRGVLATGAWLKNAACLLTAPADGPWSVRWSAVHGDLSTPEACTALQQSLHDLVEAAAGPIDAIAHDLHPDFHSTRLALDWADRLGVPAIGVQHHLAHVAVVQAEAALDPDADPSRPVIGVALDGVGLGTDGLAWGGELLLVEAPEAPPAGRTGRATGVRWQRIGHLAPIALAGGDVAAREPWRLAAAVLAGLGRGDEIEHRFAPVVGLNLARGVATMLQRRLQTPLSTSAGRWFDAASGALGLHPRQTHEAQAAMALEALADSAAGQDALAGLEAEGTGSANPAPIRATDTPRVIDLNPTMARLFSLNDAAQAGDTTALARGAALFHHDLAEGLASAAIDAAAAAGSDCVMLGGGCFLNQVLSRLLEARLVAAKLRVRRPRSVGVGDAGLALGQAWIALHQVQAEARLEGRSDDGSQPQGRLSVAEENPQCV